MLAGNFERRLPPDCASSQMPKRWNSVYSMLVMPYSYATAVRSPATMLVCLRTHLPSASTSFPQCALMSGSMSSCAAMELIC